jgi:transcriptional regulator with XRE-family HTH domain
MDEQQKIGSPKLAAKLRELRGDLTQWDAATKAGVSPGTWQNIERQVTRAQGITLKRISDGFGVPIEELRDLTDDSEIVQRFTDEELQRLAERLAPMIAIELGRLRGPKP